MSQSPSQPEISSMQIPNPTTHPTTNQTLQLIQPQTKPYNSSNHKPNRSNPTQSIFIESITFKIIRGFDDANNTCFNTVEIGEHRLTGLTADSLNLMPS